MVLAECLEDELRRIITAGAQQGVVLRAVGGLAIHIHCPSANHRALERTYPDIDLVTPRAHATRLERLMATLGYAPNKVFNTLHGDRRQMFHAASGGQVDVFIGDFEMAHRIPLTQRLHLEAWTIPLAELFLTKAQIVALNPKDVRDMLALLLDHALGNHDQETINLTVITGLCARDWGLYTTVLMNLERLHHAIQRGEVILDAPQSALAQERIQALQEAIQSAPKTLAWKLRARLGKRVCWYQEVEEVRR
ncbi:MAG: hypothetical protein ACUVSF_13785 [Anaerolineae bacterium]